MCVCQGCLPGGRECWFIEWYLVLRWERLFIGLWGWRFLQEYSRRQERVVRRVSFCFPRLGGAGATKERNLKQKPAASVASAGFPHPS